MNPNYFSMHYVENEEENIHIADMAIRRPEMLRKDAPGSLFWIHMCPSAVSCKLKKEVLQRNGIWLGKGTKFLHGPFTAKIFSVTQFHYEF